MQKRLIQEVCRPLQFGMIAQVAGAADRIDTLAEEKLRLQPFPFAATEENGNIHLLRARQDRLICRQHPQVDLWLKGAETFKPWHQPEPRKSNRGAHCQLWRLCRRTKCGEAGADIVQAARHRLEQALALCRDVNGAMEPMEQREPNAILEGLDLPADRALRKTQLLCREGKAPVTCHRLEAAQKIQWR